MAEMIAIEVAYALPDQQKIIALTVPAQCTAIEAVRLSQITQFFAEINLSAVQLGIFSVLVEHDALLKAGDRIEIYRPLICDPKEARMKKAEQKRGRKWRAKN